MTPRMTLHARQRCVEMEISTKVAKRIVQCGEVRYPGTPTEEGDTVVVLWSGEPRYAVVVSADPEDPIVLTVLFNTPDYYARAGSTYIPIVKEA
jgi:hypothetical protein